MSYQFKLGEFEGPLNLLLDLIEERKLSISSVSLAKIADDYLGHIKTLKDFPRSEVADFLVAASTLVLIKSRALLPSLEISEEEKKDILDLETRLKILKRLRELSKNIESDWGKSVMFSREAFAGYDLLFIEPKSLKISDLRTAFQGLVAAFPKITKLPEKTLEKIISIEEKMIELVSRVSSKLKASFDELVASKNRGEVIVGFLALLELVKQGALLVKQEERFGKIELESLDHKS